MPSARAKNALFEAIAVMGKAFASPRRLELLDFLAQAPRTVDELARGSGQSTANTSQHLQALHAAGMVTRTREGTRVRYALAGDEALRLWLALRATSAARLAEVERAARDYLGDEVDAIGRDELRERLSRGDVVLVDVRPAEEFEAGHIEGARSIPLDELEQRLAELPPDREVVAYCRGPFCAYAHDAVRRLRRSGRPARRLEEGWPEWHLAESAAGAEEVDIGPGELVDTFGRSASENTRGKAAKVGALGSTIRATKPIR
jgi:rhodanese-related sulfurtransferase